MVPGARGRIYLHERIGTCDPPIYARVGVVSTSGVLRLQRALPSVQSVRMNWISGGSLWRYLPIDNLPTLRGVHVLSALRTKPTAASFAMQCDGCSRKHRKGNVACTATIGTNLRSRHVPGFMYALHNRSPIGSFTETTVVESHNYVSLVRITIRL